MLLIWQDNASKNFVKMKITMRLLILLMNLKGCLFSDLIHFYFRLKIVSLKKILDMIFFTDSGPFGETAIDNCKGSLFAADLENLTCKALALYCLSFPSGICMGND